MSRTLTVIYGKSNEDVPVMCVAENKLVIDMFTGGRAEYLYKELIGQDVVVNTESEVARGEVKTVPYMNRESLKRNCETTCNKFNDMYEEHRFLLDLLEQTKWIPVSERLPRIADVYRVTRYYPNNVMNPNYIVDACFFDGSNNWYNDIRINHERAYADNVVAWQENPEPYKAESEKQL